MAVLRISIHALGGQGGGVLADWLVDVAEAEGWWAQATSVPGVAQRTGATLYYLELCPPGPAPVMALMPTPGDVDLVIASELMEAGRAIARGLVTPDRTTLVASSHRIFAIAEKSAPGNGEMSAAAVLDAAARSAKRLVLADLQALAEVHGSVVSATLFGAAAAVLPFARAACEAAIRRSGKGVATSLAAFGAAYGLAAGAVPLPPPRAAARAATAPAALRQRVAALAEAVRPIATLGVERLADYQDRAYAALYLDRLEAIAAAEAALGGDGTLVIATARHLALWMAFEDLIRVADLKTRGGRAARVETEAGVRPTQIAHATEFLHPRFEELCDLAPTAIGRWLRNSGSVRRRTRVLFAQGRTLTTTRLPGYALLWAVARLRGYRRRTLRFAEEQQRIESWLASAIDAARGDLALGVEVIRLQRLIKGYSTTHARGLHNFARIMARLPAIAAGPDAAPRLGRLHRAALADDSGTALEPLLVAA